MTKTGMLEEMAKAALDGGWLTEYTNSRDFCDINFYKNYFKVLFYNEGTHPGSMLCDHNRYQHISTIPDFILNADAMKAVYGDENIRVYHHDIAFFQPVAREDVSAWQYHSLKACKILLDGGDPIEYLYKMMKETKDER